jgi:alpha-galactosidase
MRWLRVAVYVVVIVGATLTASLPAAAQQKVALTPPMGWNSWNFFGCKVTDAAIRAQAQAMATNGMKQAGYEYVNIDDCWEGKRDAQGNIQGNERFPDMKALADYIHGLGLKFGVYSTPGPKTCAGFEGSYGHERQDAEQYARWGVDYLKYDVCSSRYMYTGDEFPGVYKKMVDALRATGRPIVFSISHGDNYRIWRWAPDIGANLWRTGGDINPDFNDISHRILLQQGLERFAGPGHWNDPDMLEVGNGDLTADSNRLHFGMWCLLAAPLLAGNDLTQASKETLEILTNPEVIAVDQDPAGIQGRSVWQEGPLSVWAKRLADGSWAVGLVNFGESPNRITARFQDVGAPDSVEVRNLWAGKDLGRFRDSFTADVPTRGMVLVKIR